MRVGSGHQDKLQASETGCNVEKEQGGEGGPSLCTFEVRDLASGLSAAAFVLLRVSQQFTFPRATFCHRRLQISQARRRVVHVARGLGHIFVLEGGGVYPIDQRAGDLNPYKIQHYRISLGDTEVTSP